ncbi:MAG: hypothetical protein E6193_05305 [Veillonella parvula]|nr:hypothetical protein [Veillonella parvula]
MKKVVLFFLLITALTGCGLNQNTNSNKTESNATSSATGSSTSAAGISQATTKQDGHLITAKQALSAGEYAKAIEEATASIKDNANNAEAYSVRGFATALNGDAAKGLTDTKEKVLEKDPSNTWSVYGIATIYADQGEDTKALDWLEKAIKIDPSVKSVAAEQDHFERFHNNGRFKTLVEL